MIFFNVLSLYWGFVAFHGVRGKEEINVFLVFFIFFSLTFSQDLPRKLSSGPGLFLLHPSWRRLKEPACRFLSEPLLTDADLPPGSAERIFSVLEIKDLRNSWKLLYSQLSDVFIYIACCFLDFVFPGCQNVGQRGIWLYVFGYIHNGIHL